MSDDNPMKDLYNLPMDRSQTKKRRLSNRADDDFVPGTMAERIALVWPLTREVVSLSPDLDVEQRLQRHITCLKHRKG